MDYLPIVFSVVLVILTVVLTVVGIQFLLVLVQFRKTLQRLNDTLDAAERRINNLVGPLKSVGAAAAGLKTGLKVFETFVSWLQRDRHEKSSQD